jgi:uncharacterized membrane protein YgaE (UPF0421/DUF939 family)
MPIGGLSPRGKLTSVEGGVGARLGARWRQLREAVSWTRPTSTEIGTVVKSALAAGLAWWLAGVVTDIPDPVLAPLTAIVVVQVSVRASVTSALQRTAAVVLGVFLALSIGDALGLNGFTVALIVAVSLGVAQLVLRMPPAAARQVPISMLVVLSAVASAHTDSGWERAVDTLIGAGVGVVVSFVLPASRLVDARQTLDRLASSLGTILDSMGAGLEQPWTPEQTDEWRRHARTARERLVDQANEAVGNSKEAARWNVRDRRHVADLARYDEVMARLERIAIGISVLSRGLDDHARLGGPTHQPMPAMGALLCALADAVRALAHDVLLQTEEETLADALVEVRARRARCARGAYRRARLALDHGADAEATDPDVTEVEGEWLNYTALLVQVDRLVVDLSAPLPT